MAKGLELKVCFCFLPPFSAEKYDMSILPLAEVSVRSLGISHAVRKHALITLLQRMKWVIEWSLLVLLQMTSRDCESKPLRLLFCQRLCAEPHIAIIPHMMQLVFDGVICVSSNLTSAFMSCTLRGIWLKPLWLWPTACKQLEAFCHRS